MKTEITGQVDLDGGEFEPQKVEDIIRDAFVGAFDAIAARVAMERQAKGSLEARHRAEVVEFEKDQADARVSLVDRLVRDAVSS